MESANSPWLLGSKDMDLLTQAFTKSLGKIPPPMRNLPALIPNQPHRLLHLLRAAIPLHSKRLIQHPPKSPHGPLGRSIPP
jgi:hypothetical protein